MIIDPDEFMDNNKVLLEKDTKLISVVRSDVTLLRVSNAFSIKNASDDMIRSLLTNSIPIEGHDQRERHLLITDFDTGEQIHFDQEKL
jgi:hypothetical protein